MTNNPFNGTSGDGGEDNPFAQPQKFTAPAGAAERAVESTVKVEAEGLRNRDWSDIISKQADSGVLAIYRSRRRKAYLIFAAAVIAIVCISAAMFFATRAVVEQNTRSTPLSAPEISAPALDPKAATSGYVNPLDKSGVTFDDPPSEAVKASIDKRVVNIRVGDGDYARVDFGKALTKDITGLSQACDLSATAASCYVGSSEINGKAVDIYAFRDAKTSNLLYSDKAVTKTGTYGAAYAYIQDMNSNADLKGLFIVFGNQSGLIVTSEDTPTLNAIAAGDGTHFEASATQPAGDQKKQ